jgi:hypothetical protein
MNSTMSGGQASLKKWPATQKCFEYSSQKRSLDGVGQTVKDPFGTPVFRICPNCEYVRETSKHLT